MQIPLFSVYSPSGKNEYLLSLLSDDQTSKILSEAKDSAHQKISTGLVSPFVGLTFRSHDIQVFTFLSCTGWMLLVGFENGPFNGVEVWVMRLSSPNLSRSPSRYLKGCTVCS